MDDPAVVVNALNFSLSSLLWQWPSDTAGLWYFGPKWKQITI